MRLLALSLLLATVALASPAPNPIPRPDVPADSPAGESKNQVQNGIMRLPMRRRAPTHVLTTMPALVAAKTHSTATPTSTFTPQPLNVTAMFKNVAYGVKVWIGTPEQSVVLDFDTGSSETWVDPPCTGWEGLQEYEDLCRTMGLYIPEQSDTSEDINATCKPRWITYGSGAVDIRYYKDTVSFTDPWDYTLTGPGLKFEKPVQFGVATWSQNMVSGIMGAGYGRGYNQKYSGFIDEIYDQNLVQDKDFAIALGSVSDGEGELIFGGVDLSKFMGPLNELPLADQYPEDEDGYFRYWINVTSIGVTQPGSCTTTPVMNSTWTDRFLPDTGTTLTYMPEEAFYGILDYFPDAKPEPGYGYSIDCKHKSKEGTIDFGFDGFTIHVPYSDFIFEIPAMFSEEGVDICILGAIPADAFFILGDTFLRASYAVFSQQKHKVYLAQFVNCGTDLVSSHGDLSKLFGNCGHRRPYPPSPVGSKSTQVQQPYGSPTSPSNYTTSAKPSATAIGFGTCRSYSTGTYTPLGYASLSSISDKARHDISMFPRPAIETARKQDDARPTAPIAPTATNSGAKPVKVVKTSIVTLEALTLPGTTLSGTVLTTTYTVTENGQRPEATGRTEKSSTSECGSTWSDYTFATPSSPVPSILSTDSYTPDASGTATAAMTTEMIFTVTGVSTTMILTMTETIDPNASVTTEMEGSEETRGSVSSDSTSSSFNWNSFFSNLSGGEFSTLTFDLSVSDYTTSWGDWSATPTSSWTSETASVAPPLTGSSYYSVSESYATSWSPESSSMSDIYFSSSPSCSSVESSTSFYESSPTVITIPIETGETVIVKLRTTTYTIIDGATVPPGQSVESSTPTTYSVMGTGTGSGTGSRSIGYTETGVWRNSTVTLSAKKTSTTKKPHHTTTTTSESSTEVDGYITVWSWTPASEFEMAKPTVTRRDVCHEAGIDAGSNGKIAKGAKRRLKPAPGAETDQDLMECGQEDCVEW